MRAAQSMTGRGGWPMTFSLAPDGTRFCGGTYFPPSDRHGLPGFPRLLQALAEAWATRRADVLDNGRQLAGALGQESRLRAAGTLLTDEILFAAFQGVSAQFDEEHGGLGGADRKSTRLNSSHLVISYAVFCLKKKKMDSTTSVV